MAKDIVTNESWLYKENVEKFVNGNLKDYGLGQAKNGSVRSKFLSLYFLDTNDSSLGHVKFDGEMMIIV